MGLFQRQSKSKSITISTASLPDIVFMLLFFFMVAAQLNTENFKKFVELERPKGDDMTKLEKKDLISYLYIGKPINKKAYPSPYILLINDKPAEVGDISKFVNSEREKYGQIDAHKITTQLTIDKDTPMGYIQEIKEALSFAGQFKINIAGDEGDPSLNFK